MSCLLASSSTGNANHTIFHQDFDQIEIYSFFYIHKKKFLIFTPSIITAAGNKPHCFFEIANQTHTICVTIPTPGPHTVLYPINQKVRIDRIEHKNPSQWCRNRLNNLHLIRRLYIGSKKKTPPFGVVFSQPDRIGLHKSLRRYFNFLFLILLCLFFLNQFQRSMKDIDFFKCFL